MKMLGLREQKGLVPDHKAGDCPCQEPPSLTFTTAPHGWVNIYITEDWNSLKEAG